MLIRKRINLGILFFMFAFVTFGQKQEKPNTWDALQGGWRCVKVEQYDILEDSSVFVSQIPIINVNDYIFKGPILYFMSYPCAINRKFLFSAGTNTLTIVTGGMSMDAKHTVQFYNDTLILAMEYFNQSLFFVPLNIDTNVFNRLLNEKVNPTCLTDIWNNNAKGTMYEYDYGEETDEAFLVDSASCFRPDTLDFRPESKHPITYQPNALILENEGKRYEYEIKSFAIRRQSEYILVLQSTEEGCKEIKSRYFRLGEEY